MFDPYISEGRGTGVWHQWQPEPVTIVLVMGGDHCDVIGTYIIREEFVDKAVGGEVTDVFSVFVFF